MPLILYHILYTLLPELTRDIARIVIVDPEANTHRLYVSCDIEEDNVFEQVCDMKDVLGDMVEHVE